MASNPLMKVGAGIQGSRPGSASLTGEIQSGRSPGQQGGFTLIELLIVIAIIGILAAIAYPSYVEQIRKTHRSDGKAALLETAQILERCYTEFNRYDMPGTGTPACPVLNVGGTALAANTDSKEGYYAISTSGNITNTTFTLQAVPQGAQADDSLNLPNRCGTLSYNNLGQKGATGPLGAARCW